MWLMAMAGLGLSAVLLHYWYRRIARLALARG
ncbi:multidrug resistance protein [Bordetella pertussis]|nr:multidrug resistance protein [Bordetella pertussis]